MSEWHTLRRRDDVVLNDELSPGEYRVKFDKKGVPGIVWKCSTCGKLLILAREHHDVRYNGTVYPSVKCGHKNCSFNEWMYLDGWIPPSQGDA